MNLISHVCFKPGNGGNSVEHDRLFKPGDDHNGFVHHIVAKSYRPLVYKCKENAELMGGNGNSAAHYQQLISYGEAHN